MTQPPVSDLNARATALRPATCAGLCAAAISILAGVAIRWWPSVETPVASAHLVLTLLLYTTAGALAARYAGDGWRAGLFAGLLDALIGHPVAFFLSAPPDPARLSLPPGIEATPAVIATAHLWGAVVGASVAIVFATGAGAAGGWYARRAGKAPRTSGNSP